MKKFLSISLIILLILSTTGVVFSKHFCNNHLVSFALFSKAKGCCGQHCKKCKEVNQSFKLSQKFVDSKEVTTQISSTTIPQLIYLIESLFSNHLFFTKEFAEFYPPPIKSGLQIFHSAFRL